MTTHDEHAHEPAATTTTSTENTDRDDVVARVVGRAENRSAGYALFRGSGAQALSANPDTEQGSDGDQSERADRQALRRVPGLSTELEDVTEVEYRQLRLENVVLIGVYSQGSVDDAENSMRELAALAETAGAVVLDGLLQRRPTPDPSTSFGRGKAEELRALVAAVGADTVIADTELAPSQRRALEDVVKVKVIDRTAVILDIFSQHAKSREGKAQVELAQLQYLLPRLRGWGDSMSRQAGGQVGGAGAGMGSRGPGETKIELDRRRINTRMARLRKQIAAMKPARDTKRANRDRNSVPSVAIVGYTNAGKSSLLNRVTKAGVLVENALFATLDATVRKTETDQGQLYTLADTVGFVRNLPHQLVEAFRSTLEELADSDVLVHVVDASHPDPAAQLATCTRSSRRWTPRPSRRSWCSTRATSPPTATASSCAASRPRASSSRPARARGSRSCVAGSQSCCRSRPSRWTSWCPSSTARSSRCSTTGRRSSRPPTSRRARACARS